MHDLYEKPILRTNTINGYVYFMDRDHALATKVGMVYMHRHVMSVAVGRWISPDEHVHHINGDRKDNRVENLQITNQSEHGRQHALEKARLLGHKHRSEINCANSECGKLFRMRHSENKYCCQACARLDSMIKGIDLDRLRKEVWELPSTKLAVKYGVSSPGLSKICKRNGIPKPPVGYWQKLASPNYGKPPKVKKVYSRGLTHGTEVGYTSHACRCALCREAHRIKARLSREIKRNASIAQTGQEQNAFNIRVAGPQSAGGTNSSDRSSAE